MIRKPGAVVAVVAAVVVLFGVIGLWRTQTPVETAAVGEAAPRPGPPDRPPPGPPMNVDVGIARGDRAPIDLALKDTAGASTTLADAMGEKGLVLLLVRSADWCPFCKTQLIETADIADDIVARGFGLASLSYDPPEVLAAFTADRAIPYAMLSDEGSVAIDAMDLRDPQYPPDHRAYGVPRASVLVLAPDGTVLARFVADDYRSRQSNEDVLAMIDAALS